MVSWQKHVLSLLCAGWFLSVAETDHSALAQPAATEAAESTTDSAEADTKTLVEESPGLQTLNEALRRKVTGNSLQDLNQVIQLLETAIDEGLEVEDNDFAERMLSDSLMERAKSLTQVINARSIGDPRVQKIRNLVTSDLGAVIAYDDPPAEAYLLLAKLQALRGGDPREARRAVGRYLKYEDLADDKRAEALILRAGMLKDRGKSIEDVDQAIQLAPENINYRLAKVLYQRLDKQLDDALQTIDEIRKLDPENGNVLIAQGEIYRQQNRPEEALASFEKATELAPQAAAPYRNRGEIYRRQGKFKEAIEQYNEVLKLQPGVMLTLLLRADAYMANEQLTEALADIDTVLEKPQGMLPAQIVAAHRLRAEILTRLDRINEAIDEMERVAAAMPEQVDLKMQLALYYTVDRQTSKAIEVYSDVLDRQPKNFIARQSRGDSYLNIGKHGEAIADFTEALKINPEDTTLLNNLAWVLSTSPEDGLRDGQRAIELATKACELTEYQTPHILSTLAAAYAESGDFDTAVKWSQKSVDMDDPEHGEQLIKELKNYQAGKPWREKQNVEQRRVEATPLEDSPQQQLNGQPLRR